jgi:5-methylcytosine-specific restriction enzyme subunit McrC
VKHVDALCEIFRANVSKPRKSADWFITPSIWIGAVRTGGVEMRVSPKTDIERVLFLLGYSTGYGGWKEGLIGLGEAPGVTPVMARLFAGAVTDALKAGPHCGYQVVEDELATVRGRIRMSQHMRNPGRSIPVPVSFNERTIDIPENRILLAAIRRAVRLPDVPATIQRRLRRAGAQLTGVRALDVRAALPTWHATRLNAHYHDALALAVTLLSGSSVEHFVGAVRVEGFVMNMQNVFEHFVRKALAQALEPYGGRVRGPDPRHHRSLHLDEDKVYAMKPDVLWFDDRGSPAAVADAKYKELSSGRLPSADIYQMLAYCARLGLQRGHLICVDGAQRRVVRRIPQPGGTAVEIIQHAPDLKRQPEELLEHIAAIAAEMAAANPERR